MTDVASTGRLSRRSLLAGLAGCATTLLCACQISTGTGTFSPINGANRPTPILGYNNGYLPITQLYTYSSECEIYRPAAGSLVDMIAAAQADGVFLTPVQGYRDYANQVYWRNWWCSVGVCGNAAVPGYSNHGWGKAADFADQDGSLTWTSVGYQWLTQHAGDWGWNHPSGVNEAWHWEWVGDGGIEHGYPIRADLMNWAPLAA